MSKSIAQLSWRLLEYIGAHRLTHASFFFLTALSLVLNFSFLFFRAFSHYLSLFRNLSDLKFFFEDPLCFNDAFYHFASSFGHSRILGYDFDPVDPWDVQICLSSRVESCDASIIVVIIKFSFSLKWWNRINHQKYEAPFARGENLGRIIWRKKSCVRLVSFHGRMFPLPFSSLSLFFFFLSLRKDKLAGKLLNLY